MGLVYMGLVGRGDWAVTGLRNHGEILIAEACYLLCVGSWGLGVCAESLVSVRRACTHAGGAEGLCVMLCEVRSRVCVRGRKGRCGL
jgi:hypothetical protein